MQEVTLTVSDTNGRDYSIKGFPASVMDDLVKRIAPKHFPNSPEPWATYISEAIFAAVGGGSRTYFLTDVPDEVAQAMDNLLAQVGWKWDNLHSYLLRAAYGNKIRLISFRGKEGEEQEFGTVIITGVKQGAFDKVALATGREDINFERMMATFMEAITEGNIKFTPKDGIPYVRPLD